MPYHISSSGGKFRVVGPFKGKPGYIYGTHSSQESARQQVKALYANTKEAGLVKFLSKPIRTGFSAGLLSAALSSHTSPQHLYAMDAALRARPQAAMINPGVQPPVKTSGFVQRHPYLSALGGIAGVGLGAAASALGHHSGPIHFDPSSVQHDEISPIIDDPAITPSTHSMSLHDAISHHYKNAPGGFAGALVRASHAPTQEHQINYDYSPKAVTRHVPLSFSDLGKGPGGGQIAGGYMPAFDKMKLDTTFGSDHDSIEHELTHAWQYGPHNTINSVKHLIGKDLDRDVITHLQPNDLDAHTSTQSYLRHTTELDARIAEMKRMYVHSHPGTDVSTPEEAEQALKWTEDVGAHSRSGYQLRGDIDQYRDDPEYPKIREYMLKRMPGLVSNASSTISKSAHWATAYFAR